VQASAEQGYDFGCPYFPALFIQASAELAWLVCRSSVLNAMAHEPVQS
jgi:hypothetical protein